MFENAEIPLESLPSVEEVSWQPIARSYLAELIAGHVVGLGIALLVAFGGTALGIIDAPGSVPKGVALYAAVHMLVVAVWSPLSVRHRGYALREHDLLYRVGVLRRKLIAIPFNRIQHVETTSGVTERLFGLATLVVYTAGGSGGDLKIRGLETDQAHRLREHILRRAGQADESG
ncbi:PH domain-containing protein [Lentisalinibacter orientalis]|uniref:PH domain-containing protein n=1 Tax=Lentisalinibacter orientalis TaxID=2992241 RepID=UPI0038689DCB